MKRTSTIAILAALAIVVAALVGWRGSRPTSPVAAVRSDGVTVVPATGTLRREEARPDAAAGPPTVTATTAATPVQPERDAVSMLADLDQVAADFDRQRRDPAWSPGTEAGLRTAFAAIAGLDAPAAIECRASLCRLTARTAANAPSEEADRAVAALQARTAAQTRASAPFAANHVNLTQNDESGEANFTAYLLRR